MNAEILTIGDEILIGQITNTNSVWIAQQLNLIGISVNYITSIGDNEQQILEALLAANKRADFVFITGGLGPTKDDITKKVLANYFKTSLQINNDVLNDVTRFFAIRNKEVSEINKNQALVPIGCTVIRNYQGTAPAMWLEKDKSVFISMPGVPFEMKALMTEQILPKIKANYKLPVIYHKTILTQGIGESALAEKIEGWESNLAQKNIKLAYLPQPGIVRLRLSIIGENENQLKQLIQNEIDELQKLISDYIYGFENYGEEQPTLHEIVAALLIKANKTISLAESCTGGYIASLFTSIPGISKVFLGSFVPYSNEAKSQLVGVSNETLQKHGAVSQQCVNELAVNTLNKFNSDYCIAVSGVAGPDGGTSDKPLGFVWIAIANKNNCKEYQFQFGDNRSRNIIMTSNAALNLLRKELLG
ncbi:MAG: competence/damage-inducible protein A [Bacteroidetes bacterium]|nr:competence/damage-inducible protein A [Bacteroidota bacterium]